MFRIAYNTNGLAHHRLDEAVDMVADLGAVRSIDELQATNTLRVGLDNTLQTRDPVYGSRDLVVLNLASDYHFQHEPILYGYAPGEASLVYCPAGPELG